VTMPFGKHKGLPISSLPTDYLEWLATLGDLSGWLRAAVNQELASRNGESAATALVTVRSVANDWYRRLAREFHPDKRGSSNEAMKAVNRGRKLLLELVWDAP